MDERELPLNDERRGSPKVGSREWRRAEWDRYTKALWKFDGIFPPALAAVHLGVSRQRVYQLMEDGVLEKLEFFGHVFLRGDELDALYSMEKERRTPGFRLTQSPA